MPFKNLICLLVSFVAIPVFGDVSDPHHILLIHSRTQQVPNWISQRIEFRKLYGGHPTSSGLQKKKTSNVHGKWGTNPTCAAASLSQHPHVVALFTVLAVCCMAGAYPRLQQQPRRGGDIPFDSAVPSRRKFFAGSSAVLAALLLPPTPAWATNWAPTEVRLEDMPDPAGWEDAEGLEEVQEMFRIGSEAESLEEEESAWSAFINKYAKRQEPWIVHLLSRAYTLRGDIRSRQIRFDSALADYNIAIQLAPYSTDPVLSRGALMELMGKYEEACSDARAVLVVSSQDAAAWNNLGSASGALGLWREAAEYFRRAFALAPDFAIAGDNYALALAELGDSPTATRVLEDILQRYPDLNDCRVCLAAILLLTDRPKEAADLWRQVQDGRYSDPAWLEGQRHWPPAVRPGLEGLLALADA